MAKVKLVTSGGFLCADVSASIFSPPLTAFAKYDASVSGATIEVVFRLNGTRALIQFGIGAIVGVASATRAPAQASHFGVNIDKEAKQLDWKAGRPVMMSVNGTTLVFE